MGCTTDYQFGRDAGFFIAMWESLCAEAGANSHQQDRRRWGRFPFETMQLAAMAEGDALPEMTTFRAIKCHDISCGGFSYYSAEKPMGDRVVLLLQTGGLRYCIEARITYSRQVKRGDQLQYLVGCQFARRLDV